MKVKDQINYAKKEVFELLSNLKSQGKIIAGYGASATTTTFIYHFEIGKFLEFIADDNPSKQYLYSPGIHIPVLPSDAIYERWPDYMLVIAWRYIEPIINEHKKYVNNGGHFIVPLPKLKVI